jgi:hypothetical protein
VKACRGVPDGPARHRPTWRVLRCRAWPAAWLGAFLAGLLVVFTGTAQAAVTAVPLGTAGTYAVLAGSGITNTGVTTIVGDVGSSPTSAETGFAACPGANCVALTGANHTAPDPNDAATQNAKIALTTAYDNAAGRTPSTIPTELAGQTLAAGVYNSTSGTFGMTGTLILDGANDPNAVFIFQTASTLITGGAANISLIRDAQACNVFWQVGSAATLGAGSTLRGTILAHDNISLGDGVTVDGRLFASEQASGAGAVTLIHDTITRPLCATSPPSATATATSTATAAPTSTATSSPTVGAPSTTGVPQVANTPVGPVQTGDGTSIDADHNRYRLLGGGTVALAAIGVTAFAVARRRRQS